MNPSLVRLIDIGRHAASPTWRYLRQSHPHHELVIVISGRQTMEMDGERWSGGSGHALLFPKRHVHSEWADPADPVRSHFISFDYPALPALLRSAVEDEAGRLRQLAHWLYDERQADPSLSSPACAALASALVAEFFRLQSPREHPMIAKTRKHMRTHLAATVSLDQLAAINKLSKFHFVRQYRAFTGRTPMEDLRLIRLNAARDLLLTSKLPMKEIAPRCGLRDEFHLSRLFGKVFGHPPRTLRGAPAKT